MLISRNFSDPYLLLKVHGDKIIKSLENNKKRRNESKGDGRKMVNEKKEENSWK